MPPTSSWTDFLKNPQNLLSLGLVSAPLVSSIGRGKQAAQQRELEQLQQQLLERQQRARETLETSPLGAEQALVQQNARQLAMIQAFGGMPAQAGVVNPYATMGTESYTPAATAASILAQRRAQLALDPSRTFVPMATLGLGQAGVTADDALNAYRAQLQQAAMPAAAATAPAKKKSGFWSKLGKVASVIVPAALAPFTGGTSLIPTLLRSGIGAGSALLGGGGLQGAILGAGMGAIPGGGAASRAPGEAVKTTLQRAILNPATLTQAAGAAIEGPTGLALSMAAPFLQRPQPPVRAPRQTALAQMTPLQPRDVTLPGPEGPYTIPFATAGQTPLPALSPQWMRTLGQQATPPSLIGSQGSSQFMDPVGPSKRMAKMLSPRPKIADASKIMQDWVAAPSSNSPTTPAPGTPVMRAPTPVERQIEPLMLALRSADAGTAIALRARIAQILRGMQ
jgi:hypothetical protein